MHRTRLATSLFVSAFTGLVVVACNGTGATNVPSVAIPSIAIPSGLPSIAIPSISIPSISIPSIEIPSGLPSIEIPSIEIPSGLPSIVIPSSLPSVAIPSVHQAPDLEAQLPSQVRGTTLEKFSIVGQDVSGSGSNADPRFQALLTQFGKTATDLSFAGAGDPSHTLDFELAAARVAGVDGNQLLAAIAAAGLNGTASAKPVVSTATISGKPVTVLTAPDGSKQYQYAKGEVLYNVSSTATDADALVTDIIAALP